MKNKRWLAAMSILVASVFVAAGCERVKGLWDKGRGYYVNKDLGIRFKTPKGWAAEGSLKQEHAKTKLLVAYRKSGSEAVILVQYTEADLKKVPLLAVARFQGGLFRMLGFVPSGEPREVAVNGRRGVELVMTGDFGNAHGNLGDYFQDKGLKDHPSQAAAAITVARVSYYVADEAKDRFYLLTLLSAMDGYDTLMRDFMELVNSFEIT